MQESSDEQVLCRNSESSENYAIRGGSSGRQEEKEKAIRLWVAAVVQMDDRMNSEPSTSYPSTRMQLGGSKGNSVGIGRSERSKQVEIGSLLPMVPDDITVNMILPRLPWRALVKLTQVNQAWQAAARSPAVYDVRARASTSQTLVTIHQYECILSLYDTATETWHRVPRPPFSHMLVARGCGCVTLHGNLYILGGNGEDFLPRKGVHVFELAGRGRWKQCASMKTARKHFACTVYDGKIYVFGGFGAGNLSEVYDPEEDLWRDIAPMLTRRIEHKVVTVGDVFCLHMGRFLEGHVEKLKWGYAHSAEIYSPEKDHWTAVPNFTVDSSMKLMGAFDSSVKVMGAAVADIVVVIDGKVHAILDECLYVYLEPLLSGKAPDALKWDGSGSWKAVRRISWDVFQVPGAGNYFNPFSRVALAATRDGELYAMVFGQTGAVNNNRRWTFLKSEGLGSVNQKLTWKRIVGPARSAYSSSDAFPMDEGSDFPFSPCMASIPGSW